MLEREIEKQIMDYLNMTGWFATKIKNVGIAGRKKMGANQGNGLPDILAMKNIFDQQCTTLLIEVKNEKGRQSESQKLFEKNALEQKAHYIVARSIEDVDKYISLGIEGKNND